MKFPFYSNLTFVILSSAFLTAAHAAPQKIDLASGTGTVEFHATGHPSALKIVGKGEKPQGVFTLDGKLLSGFAKFRLESLDTGIEMRNKHMKEKYLEVQKFPEAKLTVTKLEVPVTGSSAIPFTGTLSLHGVEKPVQGTLKLDQTDKQLSVNADFGLKLADFGISIPTFAGITMADDVQVSVQDTVNK